MQNNREDTTEKVFWELSLEFFLKNISFFIKLRINSFIFYPFLFTLHLYSLFPESTIGNFWAFEGFIKIYTLKTITVWSFKPCKRRDWSIL